MLVCMYIYLSVCVSVCLYVCLALFYFRFFRFASDAKIREIGKNIRCYLFCSVFLFLVVVMCYSSHILGSNEMKEKNIYVYFFLYVCACVCVCMRVCVHACVWLLEAEGVHLV